MDELVGLTIPEQALAAELGYYQQSSLFEPTEQDVTTWEHSQQIYYTVNELVKGIPNRYIPSLFARHVLERHGYSLHRYMARHLSSVAWKYWFEQGSILAPFRS